MNPNPYAPPRERASEEPWNTGLSAGGGLPAVSRGALWIRWVLLGSLTAGVVSLIAGAVLLRPEEDSTPDTLGAVLACVGVLCILIYALFGCIWIRLSWAMLPEAGRRTRAGTRVSPGSAVARCFIPFYNYYWVFVQSVGLCEALNRQLAAFGSTKRAPRGVAIAASILQIIPYVNLLVGPVFWLVYVFYVDGVKAEYARIGTAAGFSSP